MQFLVLFRRKWPLTLLYRPPFILKLETPTFFGHHFFISFFLFHFPVHFIVFIVYSILPFSFLLFSHTKKDQVHKREKKSKKKKKKKKDFTFSAVAHGVLRDNISRHCRPPCRCHPHLVPSKKKRPSRHPHSRRQNLSHQSAESVPNRNRTHVLLQARPLCRLAGLRVFFFLFFVLGLVFYENRKEKGRNGEDNKDNKMNRKWKRKKEMEK